MATLRHHHFSFIRAAIELGDTGLRQAWERYLAFEGGPDDARHFAARLREIAQAVRTCAAQRGLLREAELALDGLGLPVRRAAAAPMPAAGVPPVPGIDAWVGERCLLDGIDMDFYSQREWMALYEEAFGLDRPVPRSGAIALVRQEPDAADLPQLQELAAAPCPAATGGRPLVARLKALNGLALDLAQAPALADGLASWLSADLARRLAGTVVDGKALPLTTLADLIDFVNLFHHRWWTHVPRVGADRAARIVTWLAPLADALGRPVRDAALRPRHQIDLARDRMVAQAPANQDSGRQFAIVPLDRLAVPPQLSGRDGVFRAPGINVMKAEDDLEAITKWLRRFLESPRTFESYGGIVERFYLWCLWVRRLPMSSLAEEDFVAYRNFMAAPPADWVQQRTTARRAPDWRPFRGPLSAASRHLNMQVISGMLRYMVEAGYLRANAARGVIPSMKDRQLKMQIDRSFNDAQWAFLMDCWRQDYARCGPARAGGPGADGAQIGFPDAACPDQAEARAAALRRTRLVLELGSTTGLRLIELTTTRRGAITRQTVGEADIWLMKVLGKGNREREVVLYDDIKDLLDQHHRDMARAGRGFDARVGQLRVLRPEPQITATRRPGAPPSPAAVGRPEPADDGVADPLLMPLIGALREAPPRWALDPRGVPQLDRDAPRNADRYAALDRSALYASLKRFFARCARAAGRRDAAIDGQALEAASTHYLRHFFANSAASDGVGVVALRDMLGHASVATTSIYLRTERRTLVQEMAKVKRRG